MSQFLQLAGFTLGFTAFCHYVYPLIAGAPMSLPGYFIGLVAGGSYLIYRTTR